MSDFSDPRVYLFSALAVLTAALLIAWVRAAAAATRAGRGNDGWSGPPNFFEVAVGFVTNFFDTLGIGSFAPTTSLFKLKKVVPDEEIPGTMMIGHTPPVVVQAFIFIAIISVESVTLFVLVAAAVLGAWLGAGVVARLPRYRIQIGMGVALLIAAATFLMAIFEITTVGGEAAGLSGGRLALAAACLFVLGAFMTIGIGIYAPTMIVVSMMGLNPAVAFPIMMGASAFLMPVAGVAVPEGRAAMGCARRWVWPSADMPAVLLRRVHRPLAPPERHALARRGGRPLRRDPHAPLRRAGTPVPHRRGRGVSVGRPRPHYDAVEVWLIARASLERGTDWR
ncbi:sulfite exporter TauE/SafE family protein [Candidatus Palauibacter sp.]|uniref:sulfite exporter TauE/SafE family protein n=1 Tax=Candidatus Palauibacter sp. TaxID=3101350 RepID=UPI003B5BBA1E